MLLSSSLCHPRSRATKLSSSPLYALPLGPAHSSFQVQQQKRLSFELAALLVANLGLGSLASDSSPAATCCPSFCAACWKCKLPTTFSSTTSSRHRMDNFDRASGKSFHDKYSNGAFKLFSLLCRRLYRLPCCCHCHCS